MILCFASDFPPLLGGCPLAHPGGHWIRVPRRCNGAGYTADGTYLRWAFTHRIDQRLAACFQPGGWWADRSISRHKMIVRLQPSGSCPVRANRCEVSAVIAHPTAAVWGRSLTCTVGSSAPAARSAPRAAHPHCTTRCTGLAAAPRPQRQPSVSARCRYGPPPYRPCSALLLVTP